MKMNLTENKKKVIVLCSMVMLLVVAGTLSIVLNMSLAQGGETPPVGGEISTFYTELSANRELRKNEQLVLLDSIINSENSTAASIKEAEEQKLAICANIQTEMVIESVIKAQGYDNVAVVIGNDNINIFVDQAELTPQQLACIVDVVGDHTVFGVNEISVSPTVVETAE